jgi:hypothetical protein
LFNALTGSRQKVANYPGVTVEKKVGRLTTPAGRVVQIVDLPGTYSLRARSPDEEITRDAVLGRLAGEVAPDLIVCVADASNLRLSLRLALELKRVGRPVMLSLNMMDIARKRGIEIDADRLARDLGVPVVSSVAVRRGGTAALLADRQARWPSLPAAGVRLARPGRRRVARRTTRGRPAVGCWGAPLRGARCRHGANRCRAAASRGRACHPVRHVSGGVCLGNAGHGCDRGGLPLVG